MTTLTLSHLSKEHDTDTAAVNDLCLQVGDGELLALLGPSGCGKTTTLRLIAGLIQPTSGDVLFNGRSVLKMPAEKRGAVMVFQQHALFPFMTVGDNVAFGLKMQKVGKEKIKSRVTEVLAAVQLADFTARWPTQLSGGQSQRVALARALVVRPKLLLLDEPLSNLDRGLREELRDMIRELVKNAGITTIFVTHDQAEAVAIADHIAVMIAGKLRQVGTVDEVLKMPADTQVAKFFGRDSSKIIIKRQNGHKSISNPQSLISNLQ